MITFPNLDQFVAALEAHVLAVEKDWERQYGTYARHIFDHVLTDSPQWSGNFVANWNISLDGFSGSYSPYGERGPISATEFMSAKFRGDPEAISVAKGRNSDVLTAMTFLPLDSKVSINNNTPYYENIAYNVDETGKSPYLRPGNYVTPFTVPYPIGYVLKLAEAL